MILRNWHYLLILISSIAIFSALFAEYVFDLQPCELCLKQRHPYYFIIIISLIIFFIPITYKVFMYVLVQLGTIYGIFYSLWHVGVENKIFTTPKYCENALILTDDVHKLEVFIKKTPAVKCDQPTYIFRKISMALANFIYSVFFLVFLIYIRYKSLIPIPLNK